MAWFGASANDVAHGHGAQEARVIAPCAAVKSGRSGPQRGRNGLRPLAAAPGMARRQARPDRTHLSSTDGRKTQHRGGLLFTPGILPSALRAAFGVLARSLRASGDFLLATQEKVTRPPGLNRQDCRFERRRRPEGRATGMWRVVSRRRAIGEHQGQFRQHEVAETVVPGAMVFRPFLP